MTGVETLCAIIALCYPELHLGKVMVGCPPQRCEHKEITNSASSRGVAYPHGHKLGDAGTGWDDADQSACLATVLGDELIALREALSPPDFRQRPSQGIFAHGRSESSFPALIKKYARTTTAFASRLLVSAASLSVRTGAEGCRR
jgi:hypothetical protein